jgi:hypothetical protein
MEQVIAGSGMGVERYCAFCAKPHSQVSTWSNGRSMICHDCIAKIIRTLSYTNPEWVDEHVAASKSRIPTFPR